VRSFIKKLLAILSHAQVLVVFLAFALMVFFSYRFMSEIERKHLIKNVNNAISNVQTYIESDLQEPETTLNVIAENIRSNILLDASLAEVTNYIYHTSQFITSDERLETYIRGIYGYFPVFNNTMISGTGWMPPENYSPVDRPWYKSAIEAGGKMGQTSPYFSMAYGASTMTFSRAIYNDTGKLLAVICMDITLNRIWDYAMHTYITFESKDSYGILLDKDFNSLTHPHPMYSGRHINRIFNRDNFIQREYSLGNEISEYKVTDYTGKPSVVFLRSLKNGWMMMIIADSQSYYESVNKIGIMLIVLGSIFAVALSLILLRMVFAKNKAEERTQIMLDATPLCANFWDNELQIIDCNKETLKLFGFTNKKEYLASYSELSPEYQPDGRLSNEKALEVIKKAYNEGYSRVEWMHRKLNGELIPCEVTFVRVIYRKEIIICGYTRDLREIKTMMAKMREADECTQVLFDATPLSSFMIDKHSKIIECNNEIVRLFGLKGKHEFINEVFDYFPEYQPSGDISKEKVNKYIDEAYEEGYCRFEWVHQKRDGEQIPTEVTFVRVKFRGEYAVAGFIRDLRELKTMIAEMRRAEIAEESSKAKSDFLAKMSHEIRTPMNAILGITEIQLQDNTLPLTTREALERIYNSGDLLLGIINDILDLSKIEAGKLELSVASYDIASLIHDTVKLNILRYDSKPIDFKLIVDEKVPSNLFGDELRIKQILNNLLSNAFKYTQEGRIELTMSCEPLEGDETINLIFRVSDTGQGMTAEQVRKLGDKFSRFNMEANRKTEGTGLGMNITRNLIQLMKGDIFVESTPGMGSTFTVRLPQGCASKEPIGKELADNLMKLNLKNTIKMRNAQISQEFMPYGRVLVIDDVETNLYVARGLMAPYGISIDTALSGFEAVDKIRDGAVYDIIFMDHMMPRMDGIEATKLIRSLGYSKPIVALTANALAGQAEMFISNGFDDFISKPIDIRQLNAVLNRMIRDKQTQEVLDEARRQKNSLYAAGGHNIAIDPQLAEFFVRDAKKAVATLDAICQNNCRRGDDIPAFIINVHAMKSALANVGESELSNKASELEQAGRDQNVSLILSSLPSFLGELNKVIENLKPDEEESAEEAPAAMDSAESALLKEKLMEIQMACASFDKKSAKTALSILKQRTWPRTIRDQLSAIAERLLHSEFDEAAAITKEVHFI